MIMANVGESKMLPPLVSLLDIPGLIPDLRYATSNNFVGQRLYTKEEAIPRLVKPAAEALALVAADLAEMGLTLRVFDAYRPLRVQNRMWALIPDPRYVANPSEGGGRHTKGTAIDVSLEGPHGPLRMPTPFDEFSENAHRVGSDWSEEERRNSQRLEQAMTKRGFVGLPTEWWHYDFEGWENYADRDE